MALTGTLARAAARALMPDLVQHAYGANRAINYLRARGYRYRRQQMLRDYRYYTGKMKLQDRVQALGPDRLPSRADMVETDLKQPERTYRVFGEVQYYDYEAQQYYKKYVSFYDDYLRTKDQWSDEFTRQFGDVYRRAYNQAIVGVDIFSIEHNRGHLY